MSYHTKNTKKTTHVKNFVAKHANKFNKSAVMIDRKKELKKNGDFLHEGEMALTLKDQTKKHHDNIERSEFAEILLSGRISPKLYHAYLSAQYESYKALESAVVIPDNLKTIFRAPLILHDIYELETEYEFDEIVDSLKSVQGYVKYIESLKASGDNDSLLAHLYVRHFGDLHGGQIIKRRVPGLGLMYDFGQSRKELIAEMRTILNNDMGPEACKCFEFSENMFEDLLLSVSEDEWFGYEPE